MKRQQMKLLFVCGRGIRRSATAERIYSSDPRFVVRSGGTSDSSRRRVSSADVRWADLVIVMEQKHVERLESMFPVAMQEAVVRVLDIPDDFDFMEEELIREIQLGMQSVLSVFKLDI